MINKYLKHYSPIQYLYLLYCLSILFPTCDGCYEFFYNHLLLCLLLIQKMIAVLLLNLK